MSAAAATAVAAGVSAAVVSDPATMWPHNTCISIPVPRSRPSQSIKCCHDHRVDGRSCDVGTSCAAEERDRVGRRA